MLRFGCSEVRYEGEEGNDGNEWKGMMESETIHFKEFHYLISAVT